jgi:hypothetical protein
VVPSSSKQVSELLPQWENADRKALEAVLLLVYAAQEISAHDS